VDIELVEARWRAGRILTSELGAIARELAAAGHESPSVSALASAPEGGRADARSLFDSALTELGGGSMGEAEAALVLARLFARELLAGEIGPEPAARGINSLRWKGGPEVDGALGPFSELEDRYETARATGPLGGIIRILVHRRMRSEARRLLGRG
jgi:hypothetical protein